MKLLVLAGGLGSRLKPVVNDRPKSLAPINGTPILGLMIERWLSEGITEFIFLLGYRSAQIIAYVTELSCLRDVTCKFVIERSPLGTGGALINAIREEKITEEFILSNADTFCFGAVRYLVEQGFGNQIILSSMLYNGASGVVTIDGSGSVVEFCEKPADRRELCNSSLTFGINTGVYRLNGEAVRAMASTSKTQSLEHDLLPLLIANNMLKGVLLNLEFLDIGTPDGFFRAPRWLQDQEV